MVISLNSINVTNSTVIDKCENNLNEFLYDWGIAATVIGALILIWGIVQTILFITEIISDPAIAWLNNVPVALISGVLFMFALIFLGIMIFQDPCIGNIRYYYWSIGCAIFSISMIFTGTAFLVCIGSMCASGFNSDD